MRTRLVEAYLGHRLNNNELVDLVNRADEGAADLEDTFKSYSARPTDWRGEIAPGSLDKTLDTLGLKEQFAGLSEDEVWSGEDRALYRRLSQPDFDPPTELPADPPTVLNSDLSQTVENGFAAWDRDGNIRLERHELDYLMSGGYYGEKREIADDPAQASALATVMRHYNLLGAGNPNDGDGVSLADLKSWANDNALTQGGAAFSINSSYADNLERSQAIATGKPLSGEAISPDNVFQGVVGSCVLLSTIIGTDEAALRAMMSDNGDGSFKVNFADGPTETVIDPTLAERLHHSHGMDGERWPAIIELAAAQRLAGEGQRSENGLRGAIEGIDPNFAIPALTGKPADQRSIDELTLTQTRELLQFAKTESGPVICGSRPVANGDFINVEELHNGIANGHCYSIKGFDSKTDKVTLQNPWHRGEWKHGSDAVDDGVFEMPLKDFYSSFRWVTFAKRDAA